MPKFIINISGLSKRSSVFFSVFHGFESAGSLSKMISFDKIINCMGKQFYRMQ